MTFDSIGMRKTFRDLKDFLVTPRRVNPFIPSLAVYAVWAVGFTLTNLLQVEGLLEPGESRPLWLAATSIVPIALVVLSSNIVLRLKVGVLWPVAYALIIFLAGFPLLIFWLTHLDAPLASIAFVYARLMILIAISESIVGFFIEQLRKRAKELEWHQVDLLTNQDEFRKSVFEYLHDTVQGRLFGVGVQLNEAKRELTGKNAELLESAIIEIEKIRQKDIKSLGVSLNPPISTFGLIPSLHGLLAENSAVSQGQLFDLLDPPFTKKEEELLGLGIYRIVEQAIINALVHGKATEVEVSIGRRKNSVELKISNNGASLQSRQLTPGHGFSVIDGWMSKLNGRWSLTEPKGRVTVTVSIP
jgi:signal transduction histidine kinase